MNVSVEIRQLLLMLACAGTLAAAEPTKSAGAKNPPGTPPKALKREQPEYPYNMQRAGLTGAVVVDFVVNTKGDVQNPYVVSSNNPWFERPALDAILKWKFTPAMVDGRAVNTRARQQLQFEMHRVGGGMGPWYVVMDYSRGAEDGLWDVPRLGKKEGLPPALQWDKAPVPINTAFPVYPFEALKAEKSGKTKLKFLIGPDGRIVKARLMEATTPEMGLAALAMMDTWVFKPATKKDGTPCFAVLAIDHDFKPGRSSDVPVAPEAMQILRLLEKSPDKIARLAELDGAPKPLSRRPPVYPSGLREAGQPGSALVEFFIDTNGDAQLPHFISSTAPEFGYAAVQAVATWRFEPARKAGKVVVARVQIPIEFTLRAEAPVVPPEKK